MHERMHEMESGEMLGSLDDHQMMVMLQDMTTGMNEDGMIEMMHGMEDTDVDEERLRGMGMEMVQEIDAAAMATAVVDGMLTELDVDESTRQTVMEAAQAVAA